MPSPVDISTEEEFAQQIEDADKPVLAYFYSATCGHCKKQSPVLEEYVEDAEDVHTIRIQAQECLSLFKEHSVLGTPTMIIFNGGSEIARQSGFKPLEVLAEWVSDNT